MNLVIPLVAMAIPLVIVPTALLMRHARLVEEHKHLERMRAIELGRHRPDDQTWTVPARIVAGIGIVVPIVAMVLGFLSYGAGGQAVVWESCVAVAVAAILSAAYLANRHLFKADRPDFDPKPAYDPDAFDVVGSRG